MFIDKDELSVIKSLPQVMAPCEYCNARGETDGIKCEECEGRGIRIYENE